MQVGSHGDIDRENMYNFKPKILYLGDHLLNQLDHSYKFTNKFIFSF